jgi:hypothetical protein
VGAVLASEGALVVITRNRRIVLCPERDGTTTVVSVEPVAFPVGTRIEISFGPALPCNDTIFLWAKLACDLAGLGSTYLGASSPYWYNASQFYELLYATGPKPVRELISHLDGCSGGKAGEIVAEAGLARAICTDITRDQSARLLNVTRNNTRQVQPKRLGAVGPEAFPNAAYGYSSGIIRLGSVPPLAEIPFVAEAWAERLEHKKTLLSVCVNRTPITGKVDAARDNRDIDAFGCGLFHTIAKTPKDEQFGIVVNVNTPFMPITSDGKAPDCCRSSTGLPKPQQRRSGRRIGRMPEAGSHRRMWFSTIWTEQSRRLAATASSGSTNAKSSMCCGTSSQRRPGRN